MALIRRGPLSPALLVCLPFRGPLLTNKQTGFVVNHLISDMCTALHALMAAALSLLTGSSAPAALRGSALGDRCCFGCNLVGAGGWGRPISRPQMLFFGTIAFGLQASGSSSPRRFQARSLRRPPPHRRPPERLSSEGLHRPSHAAFFPPSSPSCFPASQVRLRSLCARACMCGQWEGAWSGRDGFGRSRHARVLCRSLCRHRCSSRADPCADASEPDRQGLH
jgi:hypothetical protein